MNQTFAERAAESVEGWLSVGEGRTLFQLAAAVPKGCAIVEIGSWKGKSTVWLAAGSKAGSGAKVYSIDPHTGTRDDEERARQQAGGGVIWSFDDFRRNILRAGVADVVTPLVMYSEEAVSHVKEPIGLLFIDGDHSYEGVRADFEVWSPHLVRGGVIAFHDTNVSVYPGIKKVVSESIYNSRGFAALACLDSLTYASKVERASLSEQCRKRVSHVLRYPDDYAQRIHWGVFPSPLRRWVRRAMSSFSNSVRRD